MFRSFFPQPKLFFLSALIWTSIVVAFWYLSGDGLGLWFGFDLPEGEIDPVIGVGFFVTPQFLWFYCYYLFVSAAFAFFWFIYSPHRWQWWSVVGSQLILFTSYFSVQVMVAINEWQRPFFDAVQNALSQEGGCLLYTSDAADEN